MPTYEFRCPECECRFTSETGGDRLDRCRNEDCPGVPKRLWNGAFVRSNIRAVPKG